MKKKFCIRKTLQQWLMLLVAITSVTAAQAYEYVTLNGSSSYTSDYLQSTCSGKHVKISDGATTLNVSSNLSMKEIYAPDNDLTIVLSNHAKFYIEQETSVTMSAMNVKSLTIRGEGYIYITGNDNSEALANLHRWVMVKALTALSPSHKAASRFTIPVWMATSLVMPVATS